MKRLLTFFVLTLFANMLCLSSCAPTAIPLTGKYQDIPFEVHSSKPIDEVWSNVIDLFAKKGLSIKLIDKSSGLIVSEKTSFMDSYTTELNGLAQNPNAWIVINSITDAMDVPIKPDHVKGEWNVHLKPTATGGTWININLTNIDAEANSMPSPYSRGYNYIFQAKSTGKFEAMISEMIK